MHSNRHRDLAISIAFSQVSTENLPSLSAKIRSPDDENASTWKEAADSVAPKGGLWVRFPRRSTAMDIEVKTILRGIEEERRASMEACNKAGTTAINYLHR